MLVTLLAPSLARSSEPVFFFFGVLHGTDMNVGPGGDRDGLYGGGIVDGHVGHVGGFQGGVHRVRLQGDPAGPGLHAPPVPPAQGHQERQRAGEDHCLSLLPPTVRVALR